VLAYLLLPIVNLLNRRVPRPLAILAVYVVGIALIVGVIAYLVPVIVAQVQQLVGSIPPIGQWQDIVNDLFQQYQSRVPPAIRQPIDEALNSALRTAQANITVYVQEAGLFIWGQALQVIYTVSFLIGFFIVPIWLFYVLKDQAKGRVYLDGLLHSRIRADFWNTWDIINHDLGDYVRGQLTLSLIIGVLITAGMLVLPLIGLYMPYALLLGIISTLTELIPVIGPTLGMIPGVLIGLFISPTTALAVLLVYLVVQQFENSSGARIIGGSIGIPRHPHRHHHRDGIYLWPAGRRVGCATLGECARFVHLPPPAAGGGSGGRGDQRPGSCAQDHAAQRKNRCLCDDGFIKSRAGRIDQLVLCYLPLWRGSRAMRRPSLMCGPVSCPPLPRIPV
jgi:predicted PurR-regulated permease PerM